MRGPSAWIATLDEALAGRGPEALTLCDDGERVFPNSAEAVWTSIVVSLTGNTQLAKLCSLDF
jgi:hypothetical protein